MRPLPAIVEHEKVCDCHNHVRWVLYDQRAQKVIDHIRTKRRATAVLAIARLAARLGYVIQPM